jgi:hypothetical protein
MASVLRPAPRGSPDTGFASWNEFRLQATALKAAASRLLPPEFRCRVRAPGRHMLVLAEVQLADDLTIERSSSRHGAGNLCWFGRGGALGLALLRTPAFRMALQ